MLFCQPCPEEQTFDINIVRSFWGVGCNLELKLETPLNMSMTLTVKEQKTYCFTYPLLSLQESLPDRKQN